MIAKREALVWYGLAAVAVILFVNTFQYWTALSALLGSAHARWVPIIAAVAALAVAGLWQRRRLCRAGRGEVAALGAGLVLAGLGLWLTDPAFPAKRIHVVEYILLSVIVRRALSCYADGWPLTVATALVGALFGVHDELIQGLHPQRTFGLADVGDNALSVTAGALLGHAVGLYHGRAGGGLGRRAEKSAVNDTRPSGDVVPRHLLPKAPSRDEGGPQETMTLARDRTEGAAAPVPVRSLNHMPAGDSATWPRPGPWLLGAGALLGGVVLMLVGLWQTGVRLSDLSVAVPVPLWTGAPVLGGAVAVAMLEGPDQAWARHVLGVTSVLAVTMPAYGVMSHVLALAFR